MKHFSKSGVGICLVALMLPILARAQNRPLLSLKINGGFSVVKLTHDSLVFAERRGENVAAWNGNMLLMLKNGFGKDDVRLITGLGIHNRLLNMNRYPPEFFLISLFSGPRYKDSTKIQSLEIHKTGISFPIGFEAKVSAPGRKGKHAMFIGLIVLPQVDLRTRITSHGNYPALNRNEEARELEKYRNNLPGFSLQILPQLSINHLIREKLAIATNIIPIVITAPDSLRPLLTANLGFMFNFEMSFVLPK